MRSKFQALLSPQRVGLRRERRNHVSSNSDSWYAQIDLFGAKLTASGQTAAATQLGGSRASSRLTVSAERDDHGVWPAGLDPRSLAESGGLRRIVRIGPRMRDQMVMCPARAFWPGKRLVASAVGAGSCLSAMTAAVTAFRPGSR